MASRKELGYISFWSIVIFGAPCSYGLYHSLQKMKTTSDSIGWLLLIFFLVCVMTMMVCTFVCNFKYMFDFKTVKTPKSIPQPLVTPVATEEINVEIVKI